MVSFITYIVVVIKYINKFKVRNNVYTKNIEINETIFLV